MVARAAAATRSLQLRHRASLSARPLLMPCYKEMTQRIRRPAKTVAVVARKRSLRNLEMMPRPVVCFLLDKIQHIATSYISPIVSPFLLS